MPLTVFSSSLQWPLEEKRDDAVSQNQSGSPVADSEFGNSAFGQALNEVEMILQGVQRTHVNTNYNESNLIDEAAEEQTSMFRLNPEMGGRANLVPFFPALRTSLFNNRSRDTGRSQNSWQLTTLDDIDGYLYERAKSFSNLRPNASFVVHVNSDQMEVETFSRRSVEHTPLFDGAVANSTPLGGGGYNSSGGGVGTILHLACALDSPFALAVLLIMGADASSRHTAFRRLILHEASCSDSPKCLQLLIEMGEEFYIELKESGIRVPNYTPAWGIGNQSALFAQQKGPSLRQTMQVGEAKVEPLTQFSKTLEKCLAFARRIKSGELTDCQAARGLLRQVSIPNSNKYAIAATCRVRLDNVNTADSHGNTALHWAAFKNSLNCCKILVANHSNVNAVASSSGWTPLHDAAYSDSIESLCVLVSAGADVNAKANSGATPLCFAAQENAPNATRILLEAGADPTIRCCDEQYNNPSAGSASSHQFLHRFSGYTPLHYCAHYNSYHAAKVLLEYHSQATFPVNKALLEILDLNERLPIIIAVSRGSSSVLRELLHYGARVDTERTRSCSMSTHNDDQSIESMASVERNEDTILPARSQSFDLEMEFDEQGTISPKPTSNVITPVSSPVLRAMIPSVPIDSSKAWNCISQRSIDECKMLIQEVELNWSPERHSIFHPADRQAMLELLRVGKRLEQTGTGIFIDLWPLVLSFCGRGWFEPYDHAKTLRVLHLPPPAM